MHYPISFRVTSLALGQSYDCPSASEVTLKDAGKIGQNLMTTKQNIVWVLAITLKQFNLSGAVARIFWESSVNTMATDVLAPCRTRSSAATILTLLVK